MLTPKLIQQLEEHHKKKWFRDKYPDPYGEFIDSISAETVSGVVSAWQRERRRSYLHVANYMLELLPEVRFPEIFADYSKALADPVAQNVLPEFAFHRIRTAREEDGLQVWNSLQSWSYEWETILFDWAKILMSVETAHSEFHLTYAQELRLPALDEHQLRISRDLFSWQMQHRTVARDYRNLLRYFQFASWKDVAPWGDVAAFSKAIAESCGIPNTPVIQAAENDAIQFLFPIDPPSRVVLQYGSTSGPFDAMRFLAELGKGFFYRGMNPELLVEDRICGDPSLPWFWGYLFASLLADSEGIKTFIGLKAEPLAEDATFVLQCWYRQQLLRSVYHQRATSDSSRVQELFGGLWELAFPVEPPLFLALFELCHSNNARYRAVALLRSQLVIKELRRKYGYRWFANRKWIEKAREYWWEGFQLTASDILADLQIPDDPDYPF